MATKRKGFAAPTRYAARELVIAATRCPKCGAVKGYRCVRDTGAVRKAPHVERIRLHQAGSGK